MKAPFTESSELRTGQVLDERFKVLRIIDRGGMAEVYEALDRLTHHHVALKVPLSRLENDRDFLYRFEREEMIGVTLDHPNVLKFISAGVNKCRPYIVTEYLEGETLAVRLLRQSPLSEAEAARIASQICAGTDYLHRKGVVHRDLKPDNIMLCKDHTVRIMDFGIAKSEATRRLTFAGFSPAMGTADYISPEQVQGKRGTAQSDIYALGAILYEMTTGVPPYQGDNPLVVMNARLSSDPVPPRKRNPELSPQIEEIILHALEREQSRRYTTAAAMTADLNDYGKVSSTERFIRLRPAQLWRMRRLRTPNDAILLMATVLIVLFLIWWFSHWKRHDKSALTDQPQVTQPILQGTRVASILGSLL
jgi:serine/threonine protein kinase